MTETKQPQPSFCIWCGTPILTGKLTCRLHAETEASHCDPFYDQELADTLEAERHKRRKRD